jgi:hypothetical protein
MKVGFNEVAPTIPSKKKIHMVGLKISIQCSKEKKSVAKVIGSRLIKGSLTQIDSRVGFVNMHKHILVEEN